jgi:ACS family D-galactonate transporter-like MFS transporter
MKSLKPTNIRWHVFVAILVLCSINYVDRAVLSVLMPAIQSDLGFSPIMVGFVFSAFFWGYTLMQIPSGWLCDRMQPGKVIVGTGLLWGVFQIFTGFVSSSNLFIFIRVLLGISEAPIYPAGAKLQSVWLTSTERGRGAALLDAGSAIGNALGAPICAIFMIWLDGWRGALIGAGILTIVVVIACRNLVSGTPDTNPRVNEAERDYISKAFEKEDAAESASHQSEAGTSDVLKEYIRDRSFWCMCLGFLAYDSFWYGLMTWGALYLSATQHLNITGLGGAIFIIYGIGLLGGLGGGALTDHWRKKAGSNNNAILHKLLPVIGVLIAIPMYLLSSATSVYYAVTLLSIAMFFEKWAGCTYWSMPSILAKRQHVGAVGGAMNFLGNIGGALVPIAVGFIVSITGSYFWALIMFVGFALALGILPLFIDFNKKVGTKEILN